MQARVLYTTYTNLLLAQYEKHEAQSLTMWLMEDFLGIKKKQLVENVEVGEIPKALEKAMESLMAGKPIQYITGKAHFYGREFEVNPAVLIPRNETEELVHLIIKENKKPSLRILDIGTGSGCIPISLQLEIPGSKVFGIDISETALQVAQKNAELLDAQVTFQQGDILKEEIPFTDLDIVVSNPPYVRHSEKAQMHKNVLEHEPHLALFVMDEDALVFYRVICQKAWKVLKPGGKLYFEINEAYGEATKELMENSGYTEAEILQDLNDKYRMAKAIKPD